MLHTLPSPFFFLRLTLDKLSSYSDPFIQEDDEAGLVIRYIRTADVGEETNCERKAEESKVESKAEPMLLTGNEASCTM